MNTLKELYSYRQMLISLVRKDLRTRYKGSVLGFLWTFLNPLLQLVVYSIVFSFIMRVDVDNYSMYLFVALIPWFFFQNGIMSSASSIIYSKDLVKKVYFPRLVIPLAAVCGAFMNMIYSFAVVFLALFVSGIGVGPSVLYLPLVMLVEFLFVLGLSFLFSGMNVYFRDLEHILGIVMMAWMYLTPILYTIDMVPQQFKGIFYLNPMTGIILSYRDILYYKTAPHIHNIGMAAVFGVLFIILGTVIFNRLQKGFAEEL